MTPNLKDFDCRPGVREEVKRRLANRSEWYYPRYRGLVKNAARICIAAGLALLTILPDHQPQTRTFESLPKVELTPAPVPPSALAEFRKTFLKEPLDSRLLQYLQTTQGQTLLR